MSESKSNSASSIWMFLMALLGGAFVLQRASPSGSKEAVNVAPGSQAVPTFSVDHRSLHDRLRAPLHAHFGLDDPPPTEAAPSIQRKGTILDFWSWMARPADRVASNAQHKEPVIAGDLKNRLQALAQLDFLIVTVADPVDSAENYRFDLQLDAIHKALSANAADNDVWILDRYYLPWQAARERKDPTKGGTAEQLHHSEPGVLLYRRVLQPGTTAEVSGKGERLLLVYLVGELPTSGIHKTAFFECLHEIQFLSAARGKKDDPLPTVTIAGPTFTGSAPSLASVLREAIVRDGNLLRVPQPWTFRVLTGSALGIDRQLFDDLGPSVMFGATVTKGEELRQELLNYVRERNGRMLGYELPLRVAWLTETGTGFGASQSKSISSGDKLDEQAPTIEITDFPYPLHISRVRTTYEQRRVEAKANSSSLGPGRITVPIPFEAIDVARDLPGAMTPNMTAATVDVMLAQILNTIRREGIQFVGITATDIRDPIFLADVIRDHCPDVQLLLITPDLLHGHPDYHQSMAGALVASSYPLISEAQDWCFPSAGSKRKTALSNSGAVGLYNALLLLRHMQRYGDTSEVKQPDETDSELSMTIREQNPPPLICYDLPFDTDAPGRLHRPPVWISMIGNSGLWPVDCVEAKRSQQYSVGVRHNANYAGVAPLEYVPPIPEYVPPIPRDPTRRPSYQRRLSGRLATMTLFLRILAPLCVLLVTYGVWQIDHKKSNEGPDWAYPLAVNFAPLPDGITKRLVLWYLLWTALPVWVVMAVMAEHSGVVVIMDSDVSVTSPIWFMHLALLLFSLLASYASIWLIVRPCILWFVPNCKGTISEPIQKDLPPAPLPVKPGRWERLWDKHFVDVITALVAVIVCWVLSWKFATSTFRVGQPSQRVLLLASSRDILNGISLMLPALLFAATGTACCYTKLKHISLLKQYPTERDEWLPIPAVEGKPPAEDGKAPAGKSKAGVWYLPFVRSELRGWLSWNRGLATIVLFIWCGFLLMGTVNINPQTQMFNLVLMGILLLFSVAWGWLLDAYEAVAKFRSRLQAFQQLHLIDTDPKPIAWAKVFARRELAGPIGLSGLISTLRQRDDADSKKQHQKLQKHLEEVEAELKKLSPSEAMREGFLASLKLRRREAREDLWAYEIERFIRQYFVHLRTMAIGLTSVTLLLFLAAGSFPFNTTNLLRLTTSLLLVATATVVVRSYLVLDRDEFLGHLTGANPNAVQWDWSLIQKVGIFSLLAVVALLSQAFPEMWQWMRTFLEPLMRTVR